MRTVGLGIEQLYKKINQTRNSKVPNALKKYLESIVLANNN
jgi:hypothetical protein